MRTPRHGFTIVELLVVVAVITVLVATLLPTLSKAKEVARDMRCGSNMRQCLMAITTYNSDYPKGGLKNLNPGTGNGDSCPWYSTPDMWTNHFGADPDWMAMLGDGANHFVASMGWNVYGGQHAWDEARNVRSHWRGYLLRGNYGPADIFGCNATDYRNVPINSWSGQQANIVEPSGLEATLLKDPPYQWWGPGPMSWYQAGVYTASNFDGLMARFDDGGSNMTMFLLNCPAVNLGGDVNVPGYKVFVTPHRSQYKYWEAGDTFGPAIEHPMNCGFVDGSVKWTDNNGGWVDYNLIR